MDKIRVIIAGAAGRDFHDFNTYFRNNPTYNVACFTATQIPNISGRKYPKELAGKLYPNGIKIYDEKNIEELIKKLKIDFVFLAYSDLSHQEVMDLGSRVLAAGAHYGMLGRHHTMIISKKPVVAICAVRTGCGKSSVSRAVAKYFYDKGKKVVAIRHPMPYGDLRKQTCQRFAEYEDLKKYNCTIEEREEYEPWIEQGIVVYAGVDYEKIIRMAEKEADVILWDGGNNDLPFYKADLHIVLADPHRPGHELTYYPGAVNLRMADVVIISKYNTADKKNVKIVEDNTKKVNPKAKIVYGALEIIPSNPSMIHNKNVLIVEDGPTLTHGGMTYGAGTIAAKKYNAKNIVDPRRYLVGEIKKTFTKYHGIGKLLPAMGYSKKQIKDLQKTINRVKCDVVIDGTPVNLQKILKINKPWVTVEYTYKDAGKIKLNNLLKRIL